MSSWVESTEASSSNTSAPSWTVQWDGRTFKGKMTTPWFSRRLPMKLSVSHWDWTKVKIYSDMICYGKACWIFRVGIWGLSVDFPLNQFWDCLNLAQTSAGRRFPPHHHGILWKRRKGCSCRFCFCSLDMQVTWANTWGAVIGVWRSVNALDVFQGILTCHIRHIHCCTEVPWSHPSICGQERTVWRYLLQIGSGLLWLHQNRSGTPA